MLCVVWVGGNKFEKKMNIYYRKTVGNGPLSMTRCIQWGVKMRQLPLIRNIVAMHRKEILFPSQFH